MSAPISLVPSRRPECAAAAQPAVGARRVANRVFTQAPRTFEGGARPSPRTPCRSTSSLFDRAVGQAPRSGRISEPAAHWSTLGAAGDPSSSWGGCSNARGEMPRGTAGAGSRFEGFRAFFALGRSNSCQPRNHSIAAAKTPWGGPKTSRPCGPMPGRVSPRARPLGEQLPSKEGRLRAPKRRRFRCSQRGPGRHAAPRSHRRGRGRRWNLGGRRAGRTVTYPLLAGRGARPPGPGRHDRNTGGRRWGRAARKAF